MCNYLVWNGPNIEQEYWDNYFDWTLLYQTFCAMACFFWWNLKDDACVNPLLQGWHLKTFSLLWCCSWNLRALACLKAFWQGKHLNRFSPLLLCCSWWPFNPDAWENALPQIMHWKGFSPVCTLKCSFKVPFWMKDFPHSSQVNGFSPLWNCTCLFRPTRFE